MSESGNKRCGVLGSQMMDQERITSSGSSSLLDGSASNYLKCFDAVGWGVSRKGIRLVKTCSSFSNGSAWRPGPTGVTPGKKAKNRQTDTYLMAFFQDNLGKPAPEI